MTLQEIVQEVHLLSLEERKELISILVDTLTEPTPLARTRDILEFEGVGESLRGDIDAQEYVNQLRAEWDHRP